MEYSQDTHPDFPQIVIDNPTHALGRVAEYWRNHFDIPVIGITGSNGKTTTKDLIAHFLSDSYSVHKTTGNFNTSIGLPLMIFTLTDSHTVSILEMGANQPGDIETLCSLALPTHGLITNIVPAHLEGFGSIDAITREKGRLFQAVFEGTTFINQSDGRVSALSHGSQTVTYGFSSFENIPTPSHNAWSFVRPEAVDFSCQLNRMESGQIQLIVNGHEFNTGSPDVALAKNLLAAISVAITMKIDWVSIASRIATFQPVKGRCVVKQINGMNIIDDTYNANLTSTLSALDVLIHIVNAKRRFFVFGDMFELGSESKADHVTVGNHCNTLSLDGVFTVGKATIDTDAVLREDLFHRHFDSKVDLADLLVETLKPGDAVLFKGSRGMAMETVMNQVLGTA